MELENTFIEGLRILHLNKITDNRGGFTKMFNEDFFNAHNLTTAIKESYFSVSHKNVIRGMHFQSPPADHTKLVFVNQGSITDVVLDIRTQSPTFGKYYSLDISTDHPKLVYIPSGCGHGFLSREDNTIVSYMQTSVYNKDCDMGILWSSFGMDWKVASPIISVRDGAFDSFDNFKSVF